MSATSDSNVTSAAAVVMSERDANELAARRANDLKLAAAYSGWKPLVVWYVFWAILLTIGSISALAGGSVGTFFIGLVVAGLSAKYSHYLYHGGRRRVWFFFF